MPEDRGAYLAEPSGPAMAGVLVVHDYYGLLPHVRGLCDALAGAGMAALAPDLYGGRSTTDPDEAERLMDGLGRADALGRLGAAVDQLRDRVGGGPVGGVGFSMGGWLGFLQATTGTLGAYVGYYTALEAPDLAPIPCPVLLQLCEVDDWDPPDTPERSAAALRELGTQVEVVTYPGTGHSFANRDVPAYAPAQAGEAWSTTLGFLHRHLAGGRPG